MIDIYLAAYCGVVHLEERGNNKEWHEEPKCIGVDVMHDSGWGASALNFDNSLNDRTTAIGIVRSFEFNDTFHYGATCGVFQGGYDTPAYCLPFVRFNFDNFAIDGSIAPIEGWPLMGVLKYRFNYE